MPRKKKSQKNDLELQFLEIFKELCPELPEPIRQYRFHKKRLWRMDFAWPEYKIFVEIQGGAFARRGRSGHNTGLGQAKDYEKWRVAARMGWTVLPFNTHDLQKKKSKPKIGKSGKTLALMRKFTIYDSVLFVAEFLEKRMES